MQVDQERKTEIFDRNGVTVISLEKNPGDLKCKADKNIKRGSIQDVTIGTKKTRSKKKKKKKKGL
jgi:hypothetical protein